MCIFLLDVLISHDSTSRHIFQGELHRRSPQTEVEVFGAVDLICRHVVTEIQQRCVNAPVCRGVFHIPTGISVS